MFFFKNILTNISQFFLIIDLQVILGSKIIRHKVVIQLMILNKVLVPITNLVGQYIAWSDTGMFWVVRNIG